MFRGALKVRRSVIFRSLSWELSRFWISCSLSTWCLLLSCSLWRTRWWRWLLEWGGLVLTRRCQIILVILLITFRWSRWLELRLECVYVFCLLYDLALSLVLNFFFWKELVAYLFVKYNVQSCYNLDMMTCSTELWYILSFIKNSIASEVTSFVLWHWWSRLLLMFRLFFGMLFPLF